MRFRLAARLSPIAAFVFVVAPALATTITYDFTGTTHLEAGAFVSIPAGSIVTGSFTIDFDAANPTQSFGDMDSTSGWQRAAEGGAQVNGTPPPAALVFSGSFSVSGEATYATGPISPLLTSSRIAGSNSGILSGEVAIQPQSGPWTDFQISLASNSDALEPWLSNGVPNLDIISLGDSSGLLQSGVNGKDEVGFALTSLSAASSVPPGGAPVPTPPIPLPPALWLCISGLGMLGFSRGNYSTVTLFARLRG